MLTGKHLIGGRWEVGDTQFSSSPATGEPQLFWNGTPDIVSQSANAASAAFDEYCNLSRQKRAGFLDEIAAQMELSGEDIVQIAAAESGLPASRLQGELGRTTGQLRLFAQHILEGEYLDRRMTTALPDREPLPRPELRLIMRPIGPVVVFGASNFPLAFSTAGGDTASALASGCPVIVKGHPAHPGTSERVAACIIAAARKTEVPDGVFSLIQDAGYETARALVQHPQVMAVAFTGSLAAGRSLFDLCASRPEPVPFFGELGSINPGFVLPGALTNRGSDIAAGWATSLTLGAGQFCTNPGVIFLPEGAHADEFVDIAVSSLDKVAAQAMLTDGIASSCRKGTKILESIAGVSRRLGESCGGRSTMPALFETDSRTWRENSELSEEVFGPVGLVVRASSADEFADLARSLTGQLTATLHIDAGDDEFAMHLIPILERKAGRLLANGFPTGVEVDASMMHGGPYPASTNAAATSVGTLAIRRFLRPICYQNMPIQLLPPDLQALDKTSY